MESWRAVHPMAVSSALPTQLLDVQETVPWCTVAKSEAEGALVSIPRGSTGRITSPRPMARPRTAKTDFGFCICSVGCSGMATLHGICVNSAKSMDSSWRWMNGTFVVTLPLICLRLSHGNASWNKSSQDGSYSRARHRSLGKGGPVPLRRSLCPWGFPWLSASNQGKAQLANFFIKQCFLAIQLQIQANRFWLLEHPEDVGKTKSGEVPASIWQLPELRALVDLSGSTWDLS